MIAALLVFLGGGLGSVARHGVNLAAGRMGGDFPWATFTVNVAGSFTMGLIAGWLAFKVGEGWSQNVRLLLTTGFLGGFTTFSTLTVQTVLEADGGKTGTAAAYLALTVVGGMAAAILGYFVGKAVA